MWRLLRLYLQDEGFPTIATTGEPELLADLQSWLAELYPLPGPKKYYPNPNYPPTEPGVAIVTKSIGSGKNYSTPATWEADLDNGAVYSASDRAVGEMYDNWTGTLTINGGTTIGLADVHLTVANGYQHDGTASSGVCITGAVYINPGTTNINYWVSWTEVKTGDSQGQGIVAVTLRQMAVWNCIVHDISVAVGNWPTGIKVSGNSSATSDVWCNRNIVYKIANTLNSATRHAYGIWCTAALAGAYKINIVNNTVWKIEQTGGGTASAYGIHNNAWSNANNIEKNNYAGDSYSSGGSEADFTIAGSATTYANVSADTTGSITSKAASNQFVNTSSGFEDLHLKAGADCIDVGEDLDTTHHGAEIDIDGTDIDASGATWDAGADEYVGAGPSAVLGVIGGGIGQIIIG